MLSPVFSVGGRLDDWRMIVEHYMKPKFCHEDFKFCFIGRPTLLGGLYLTEGCESGSAESILVIDGWPEEN